MKSIVSMALILILSTLAHAEPLTQQRFLELLKEHDQRFLETMKELERSHLLPDLELPSDALLLEAKNGMVVADNRSFGRSEVGLTKPLNKSGTEAHLGLAHNHRSSQSVVKVEVRQDLSRDLWGQAHHHRQEKLRLRQVQQRLQAEELLEAYLAAQLQVYFDWQLAYYRLQTASMQYEKSKTLAKTIAERRQLQIASQLDEQRAQYQVLNRRLQVAEVQADFEALEAQMQTLLGQETIPLPVKPEVKPREGWRRQQQVFMEHGRSVRLQKLEREILKNEHSLLHQELKPDLGAYAGFQFNPGEDRDAASSDERTGLVFGLQFSYTLADHQRRARRSDLGLQRMAAQHRLQSFTVHSRAALVKLERSIAAGIERSRLLKQRLELARKITVSSEQRFRKGIDSLEPWINSETEESAAEFDYLEHLVKTQRLLMNWDSLTDRLHPGG